VVTLGPGDVFYLPRGVAHAATAACDGGEASVHVTVGVDLDLALTWQGTLHAGARAGTTRLDARRGSTQVAVSLTCKDADAAAVVHAGIAHAATLAPILRRACLPALRSHSLPQFREAFANWREEALPQFREAFEGAAAALQAEAEAGARAVSNWRRGQYISSRELPRRASRKELMPPDAQAAAPASTRRRSSRR